MRPSNKQRSRNKPGNNQQRRGNMGNIVNRVFESAGPDGKVRGTPQQIIDKYQVLARDAQVTGDRVAAESYLQHAEHYTRLLSEAQRQFQESRPERDGRDDRDARGDVRDDRDGRDEREDRDVREEAGSRDEDRSFVPQGGGRENQRHVPQRQAETAGLTTFGADEPGDHGPVETPEASSWQRTEPEPQQPTAEGEQVSQPEASAPQPQPEASAPQPQPEEGAPQAEASPEVPEETAPPPKRPRARRKKQPAPEPVAEAPAD